MTAAPARGGEGGTRPSLHFTARSGWVNDPVALVRHDGRFHLFYQYVEGSPTWRPAIGWGHASSEDLRSWTEHPPALGPGDGDLGCWSGSLVTGRGRTVLLYTSVNDPDHDLAVVREARPVDRSWDRWTKGPVVARPPAGAGVTAFRDPSGFSDGPVWRMLVGAGYADGTAGLLGYSSTDLRTWGYDGPVAERGRPDAGHRTEIWECPHLVRVGGHDAAHDLLVASLWADRETRYVEAGVGAYRDGRFTATRWQRLTYGGTYAATPFVDAGGRPGLVFWLREVRDEAAGWSGALSVPYLVSVADGEVLLRPHPALRGAGPATWRVVRHGDDPLSVALPDGTALQVGSTRRGFRLSAGGRTVSVPRGPGAADLVVDGPVAELCTGTAVASLPLAP